MDDEESKDELGEGDIEEQLVEDEYEDVHGESTAPKVEDPGITVKQYVCTVCGKTVKEAVRLVPPMHHGVLMKEVKDFEGDLSFKEPVVKKGSKPVKKKSKKR